MLELPQRLYRIFLLSSFLYKLSFVNNKNVHSGREVAEGDKSPQLIVHAHF